VAEGKIPSAFARIKPDWRLQWGIGILTLLGGKKWDIVELLTNEFPIFAGWQEITKQQGAACYVEHTPSLWILKGD